MLVELVDRLLELKRPETVVVGERTYSTVNLAIPPAEPVADALVFSTLGSLVRYLEAKVFAADRRNVPYLIHVRNATEVALLGAVEGRQRKREVLAEARAISGSFKPDVFMPMDTFRVALLAGFVDTPERADLIAEAATVVDLREDSDDGVGQTLVRRVGIANKNAKERPGRAVELRPWRTFRELEQQPASPFILRLRGDAEKGLEAALIAVDGSSWTLAAREEIASHLTELLESVGIDDIPVIW